MHGDDQSPAEETLPPRRHEVRGKDHVVAVEQAEHGFDEVSEQPQRRPQRKEKTIWDLMGPKPHLSGARNRRGLLTGCEEGVGVEVVAQTIITTVEGRQQIPLVPAHPGHSFGKGKDVDPDKDSSAP